jgi:hypothetical protein
MKGMFEENLILMKSKSKNNSPLLFPRRRGNCFYGSVKNEKLSSKSN